MQAASGVAGRANVGLSPASSFLSGEFQKIDVAGGADGQAMFRFLPVVVQTEYSLRQLNQLFGRLAAQHTNKLMSPLDQLPTSGVAMRCARI